MITILEALNENTLSAAPKKNKKIYFQDPFIYHSVSALVHQDLSYEKIAHTLKSPHQVSELIEGIVINHCKRHHSTFYIKGDLGEVDVAIIDKNHFTPMEVKWTAQLRAEDLKQIQRYPNGLVLWNRAENQVFQKTPVVPLPRFLLSTDKPSFTT